MSKYVNKWTIISTIVGIWLYNRWNRGGGTPAVGGFKPSTSSQGGGTPGTQAPLV